MGDISTGLTIAFQSGFLAEIIDASLDGMTRPKIDMAHMASTAVRAQKLGRLYTPPDLRVQLLFDPDEEPPIAEDAESVTITFPNGATWVGTAGLTDFSGSFPLEDRMTCECVLGFVGAITVTPAA